MVTDVVNGHDGPSSNSGRDCIPHRANTLEKSMNPTILSPSMGKYQGRLCSLTLLWQPVWEKENS